VKVLVAMSGGVDSSVAAAVAVEAGHEVVGVTLKLWEGPNGEAPTAGCCTVSDAEDARRVAAQLGIPYYVLDYTAEFTGGVVDRFVADYASGRTPNPCVECNRTVKFDHLLGHAAELGCDVLATGHYARTDRVGGRWRLLAGADPSKDQSYVLSMLGQDELSKVWFPVGGLTKPETRERAARLGLRTATKPDSQDICFVGQGDYREIVRELAPEAAVPGALVATDGTVLGHHGGVVDFTVGQRRGLGLSGGEPRFVLEIRPDSAEVVVGTRADLAVGGATVADMRFVAGEPPTDVTGLSAKVRYRSAPAPIAGLIPQGEAWTVTFDEPQVAVAPGQTLAVYRRDEVVGGGIIDTPIAA
jgi:tRNA-specific 2-thiouridylase